MKKILYLFLFFGSIFLGTSQLSAQKLVDNNSTIQKIEDTVLVAYPNPVKTSLYIKTKDENLKIKSVTFYSILGNQIATFTINSISSEINLEKMRPGKYLMKYVLSDNTTKIKQIIKQ